MSLTRFRSAPSRALLAGGVVLTVAAAMAPVSRATAASAPVTKVASHIHVLPTFERRNDCVLPIVVSVTCAGVGTPMTAGTGPIQTSPAVYIVQWGWKGTDPAGLGAYQQKFFNGIGGTPWNGSQTQYCANPAQPLGLDCTGATSFVGNPTGVLKGVWVDDTNAVPSNPNDAAIQAEAARAAVHFGNTTQASNASTQYIIDTPHGNSTTGFATQWCSYHGWAATSSGNVSYTDFPYIPDAGGSCGQNFVNSGSAGTLDGVSIVGGHEFAESETDPNPPNGWTDFTFAENGDKCAWIQIGPGAIRNISISTGTFAVQSLWSNKANSGAGGCVTS
jgi:serine protease